MTIRRPRRPRSRSPLTALFVAGIAVLASLLAAPLALAKTDGAATVPVAVEIVEEQGGLFEGVADFLMAFQRRANAEVSFHMNAIERGENLGAFLLALAVAFAYGAVHALGPGHGKFVVVSYFLGREARVMRGVVMAVQIAVVHVIAAIVIVWLADLVLRGGFGLGLSDVPGVRAASFLIIVGIGIYMLYQAVRASLRARATARTGMNTVIITVVTTGTVTDTITIMTTAAAMAAKQRAASWRSRPGWSPARGPCSSCCTRWRTT